MPAARFSILRFAGLILALATGLCGCHANQAPARPKAAPATAMAPAPQPGALSIPTVQVPREVRLGIDVLETGNFLLLQGRRIGLLTHAAGVDRRGVPTVEILRRAPGVHLVALFATEHGIYGTDTAGNPFPDSIDRLTGLPVYSLYNGRIPHRPTKAQLRGIDALVIDLQDIGVRSYTFAAAMKEAMEGCFENNVEVIVLDRPNPLGGLKVDGPLLDPQ